MKKLGSVAMYIGAALQHPLPSCNGAGPSSTIRVDQYKTKFSDVRIYCSMADSELVNSYWKTTKTGEPTEEFIKERIFFDAVHYRDCYMSMEEFLSPEEWECVKDPADYPELLCSNKEELRSYVNEKEELAKKYPAYLNSLLERWKVASSQDLYEYLCKVCNFLYIVYLMINLAWCTDTHLDFLEQNPEKFIKFCESLRDVRSDGILLTGDISDKKNLVYQLSALERIVQKPVYFVLGNHDFYGASVQTTRKEMNDLCGMSQFMKYLSGVSYIPLTPSTALIGHDGWYDAGYGDIRRTSIIMNDWLKIEDFARHHVVMPYVMPNFKRIIEICQRLAYEGVIHIMNGIKAAAKYHKHILIATHFPPFDEANVHNGRPAAPGYKPWYSSKMMGDMLRQAATHYPDVKFDVYAGHSHGKVDVDISHNLSCHVGGAEYNHPQLQNVIVVQ